MAGEFDLIRRYFTRSAPSDLGVDLSVGDDCALLSVPAGHQLAVSLDTLVEGQHFLPNTAPELIASRLVGSTVSDLAAMGAEPRWLTLGLTLPLADEAWVKAFSTELHQCLDTYKMALVGGDTTKGPLALSAQVHGVLPQGQGLTRHGAQVGDLICVTGTLGDSHAGLQIELKNLSPALSAADSDYLLSRFYAPTPRIQAGIVLRGLATSCIDISDGLLADLSHILSASGVGAALDLEALPLSDSLIHALGLTKAQIAALTGGEDFELCFTLPAEHRAVLNNLGVAACVIGQVSEHLGVSGLESLDLNKAGFDHFA
ncbi:MAG: thiamine-phosphate kinase [Pontibacterium sp.]